MAFTDLGEGILGLFGEAQNFVTIDSVEEFKRASGLGRSGSKKGAPANIGFAVRDPRAAHRRYNAMQRVRGRCYSCNTPCKGARCATCEAKRRHRERVARWGEGYAERKCDCGCGETLAPNQRRFINATHKARHWYRVKCSKKAQHALRSS